MRAGEPGLRRLDGRALPGARPESLFGPVVPIPDDAPDLDRLLGFAGPGLTAVAGPDGGAVVTAIRSPLPTLTNGTHTM